MRYCELNLPSPAENLAADEALLDLSEAGQAGDLLRFWQSAQHFIVLGYANKVATETNPAACRQLGIPVLRRCSGGGTVLQGPGCFNYSLVLRIDDGGPLRSIAGTNEFIMEKHRACLAALLNRPVTQEGHTDLALRGIKFSGNAQRRRQRSVLFHGSFLLDLDISLVERVLPLPSQQPSYRERRSHRDFLVNLGLPPAAVQSALCQAWQASEPFADLPFANIERLVREKYSRDEWNLKF